MRILIVSPVAEPERGAAVIRVNGFRDYFQRQSHEVHILSPQRGPHTSMEGITRYRSMLHLCGLLLCRRKVHALIGVSPPMTHNIVVLMAAKLRGIPFILDAKDLFTYTLLRMGILRRHSLKRLVYEIIEQIVYRHADHILVLNKGIGQYIERTYHLRKDKITIAPNGSDTDIIRYDEAERRRLRASLRIPQASTVIVYAGGVGDEEHGPFLKGISSLLEKHNAHVLLLLFSEPGNKIVESIERLKDTIPMRKRVHIIKNVRYQDIYKYLSAADTGVDFWPDFEYWVIPTKVYDYLACGLPVVVKSTRNNFVLRNLLHTHGIGHATETWGEFYRRLEQTIENRAAYKQRGHKARALIKSTCSRQETNRRVLAVIARYARSGQKRRESRQ